ncbi:hypothetical protein VPH35_054867 [Triticum aestivum]
MSSWAGQADGLWELHVLKERTVRELREAAKALTVRRAADRTHHGGTGQGRPPLAGPTTFLKPTMVRIPPPPQAIVFSLG